VDQLTASFPALINTMEKERTNFQLNQVQNQIKENPENKALQIRLAMVHIEGGNQAEGEKIFQTLALDSSIDIQSAAKNNLGNLAYLKEDYAAAAKYYEEAAVLSPDDGGISLNRARTAWKMNDPETAKKLVAEARNLRPDWREYAKDFPAELTGQ